MNTPVKLSLLAGGLLATTALSSAATQWVAYQVGYHPALGKPIIAGFYEPFGWMAWQNESWATQVKSAFLWPNMGAAGLFLAVFAAVLARNLYLSQNRRKPKPFPDVHGSARFADFNDIREMGLLDNADGVYVGAWENPETGMVHYLRDRSGAHIAGIAPTRSGKGLGWVLPNLLSWPESAFVYDPKGELWQLTAGWRKSIGQNVLRWQPGHPDASCGFNFLEEVRLGTDYETGDAQNIAHLIVDPDGAGFSSHWDKAAFGFLTGLFLHCLHVAQNNGTVASIPTVAVLLSSPKVDPLTLCKAMAASKHGAAINAAGVDQLKRDDKERGAVLSTVKTYLSLFLDPIVARNTSRSSFRLKDLMDHDRPTTLYVTAMAVDSVRLRPLIRLLITMMLNHTVGVPVQFDAEQQPVRSHRHKLLLMMEELPDLRKMKMLEQALAVMAGAGITGFLLMQDREQLLGAYGQHQSVLSNVHITGAYPPNEGKTADWLSHELGNQTINLEQYSESGKRGSRLSNISHSYHSFSQPLLTPDEVKRLRGPTKEGSRVTKAGQMLIMPTGQRPILGRQMLYFQDPVFDARSRILPPVTSDDINLIRQFKVVVA